MKKILKKIKERIKRNIYIFTIWELVESHYFYFLNRITNYKFIKASFFKKLGYPLNLRNPISYNEKIHWKKVYDRNPLLPLTADKYLVRTYIEEIMGKSIAKEILIPQFYVTNNPKTIPFETIPLPFIIKPNHASGRYIIVREENYNKEEIIKTCWGWLKTPYGLEKMEWAYQPIKRKIVVEKLLLDNGNIPMDYKFQMFHGKCVNIVVISGRMTNRFTYKFDPNWNYIPSEHYVSRSGIEVMQPKKYEIMLEYAERLAKPFDYVRVDLYNIDGHIYFGELTHYPNSGNRKFRRPSYDYELGKNWNIKSKYWKIKENINS